MKSLYKKYRNGSYMTPSSDNLRTNKPMVSDFVRDPNTGEAVSDRTKALVLTQTPSSPGTISKYSKRGRAETIKDIVLNPMTSAQQLINKQPVTGRGPKNIYDSAFDVFPAVLAAKQLPKVPGNIQRGEYMQAGLNALTALPLLPKVPRRLPKVFSEGQPYEGAPHIYKDMYPINGRYQPRTVITDAGVKNEILGLEPTPVVPTNAIEYPVTPNKFLNQTYDDFGKMEQGVVNNTTKPTTQQDILNNLFNRKKKYGGNLYKTMK